MRGKALLLLLALAAHTASSEVAVCSLPASALYVQSSNGSLVACGSSALSDVCQTACSCRRLKKDQNVYNLCLNSSAAFDCGAAENATSCTQGKRLRCFGQYCNVLTFLGVLALPLLH
jgi:hypothetical protein